MSSIYQLFNQNFVSSELYYLPIDAGINKILTCKDLLGQFEWSSLSNIAVTDIKSDNSNILVNNTYNTFQKGQITLSLNNNLNNLNLVVSDTFTCNRIYTDNIYEKTLGSNITLNNNIKLNSNNVISLADNTNRFDTIWTNNLNSSNLVAFSNFIDNIYEKTVGNNINIYNDVKLNVNTDILVLNDNQCNIGSLSYRFQNIYSVNLYGQIQTNNQPYITVLSNLIQAGNLDKINTNNIQPLTANISLGTSINPFHSLFLSSTLFSLTLNSTNLYVNQIFEKTINSKIGLNNDIILNSNNTINLADNTNKFANIYSTNLYGDVRSNNQPYITVMTNLITAGNLTNINTNNIQPVNSNVSFGTSINPFHSIFLSSTLFSLTSNSTNLYVNNIYEKTPSNKIKVFNDLVLQDKNIEFKTDNASFIGSSGVKLNNIYTSNINITNIIGNSSNINIIGNLIPDNNNNYSIGSSSFYFNNGYFTNFNITNNYVSNQYVDNLYEKTSSNNININNNVDMKNNDLKDIKNIYLDEIHSASINDIEIKNNIDMNSKYITGLTYVNFGGSNLDYYEFGFGYMNYGRAWTASIGYHYIRIGKFVMIFFDSDSVSRNVTNDYLTISTLPSALRPVKTIFMSSIYASNNSTAALLSMAIQTNGEIIIGNSSLDIFASFTAGNPVIAGFYAFSISYIVN
jgi:hypothetical protein